MLLSEIGPNLARFPMAAAFCSWLRLCPDPRISGGQVLSSRTHSTKNRAALALRVATQALHRSDSFLGDYFCRMKARMGVPKAMTATAHKLARIIYYMVTTQQEYDAPFSKSRSNVGDLRNQLDCMRKLQNSDSNSCRSIVFLLCSLRGSRWLYGCPSKGPDRSRPKQKQEQKQRLDASLTATTFAEARLKN